MPSVFEVRVPASADVTDGPAARPDALAVFAARADAARFAWSSNAELRVAEIDVIAAGATVTPGTVPYREWPVALPDPATATNAQLQQVLDESRHVERVRFAAKELMRRATP